MLVVKRWYLYHHFLIKMSTHNNDHVIDHMIEHYKYTDGTNISQEHAKEYFAMLPAEDVKDKDSQHDILKYTKKILREAKETERILENKWNASGWYDRNISSSAETQKLYKKLENAKERIKLLEKKRTENHLAKLKSKQQSKQAISLDKSTRAKANNFNKSLELVGRKMEKIVDDPLLDAVVIHMNNVREEWNTLAEKEENEPIEINDIINKLRPEISVLKSARDAKHDLSKFIGEPYNYGKTVVSMYQEMFMSKRRDLEERDSRNLTGVCNWVNIHVDYTDINVGNHQPYFLLGRDTDSSEVFNSDAGDERIFTIPFKKQKQKNFCYDVVALRDYLLLHIAKLKDAKGDNIVTHQVHDYTFYEKQGNKWIINGSPGSYTELEFSNLLELIEQNPEMFTNKIMNPAWSNFSEHQDDMEQFLNPNMIYNALFYFQDWQRWDSDRRNGKIEAKDVEALKQFMQMDPKASFEDTWEEYFTRNGFNVFGYLGDFVDFSIDKLYNYAVKPIWNHFKNYKLIKAMKGIFERILCLASGVTVIVTLGTTIVTSLAYGLFAGFILGLVGVVRHAFRVDKNTTFKESITNDYNSVVSSLTKMMNYLADKGKIMYEKIMEFAFTKLLPWLKDAWFAVKETFYASLENRESGVFSNSQLNIYSKSQEGQEKRLKQGNFKRLMWFFDKGTVTKFRWFFEWVEKCSLILCKSVGNSLTQHFTTNSASTYSLDGKMFQLGMTGMSLNAEIRCKEKQRMGRLPKGFDQNCKSEAWGWIIDSATQLFNIRNVLLQAKFIILAKGGELLARYSWLGIGGVVYSAISCTIKFATSDIPVIQQLINSEKEEPKKKKPVSDSRQAYNKQKKKRNKQKKKRRKEEERRQQKEQIAVPTYTLKKRLRLQKKKQNNHKFSMST